MSRHRPWLGPSRDTRKKSEWIPPGPCVYCGKPDATDIDHVVALSRGGSDDPVNLVRACRRCNASKGGRPVTAAMLLALVERADRATAELARADLDSYLRTVAAPPPEKKRWAESRTALRELIEYDLGRSLRSWMQERRAADPALGLRALARELRELTGRPVSHQTLMRWHPDLSGLSAVTDEQRRELSAVLVPPDEEAPSLTADAG